MSEQPESNEDRLRNALLEISYKTTHGDWVMQDEEHRRRHGGGWTRVSWVAEIANAALDSVEAPR